MQLNYGKREAFFDEEWARFVLGSVPSGGKSLTLNFIDSSFHIWTKQYTVLNLKVDNIILYYENFTPLTYYDFIK